MSLVYHGSILLYSALGAEPGLFKSRSPKQQADGEMRLSIKDTSLSSNIRNVKKIHQSQHCTIQRSKQSRGLFGTHLRVIFS